MGEGQPEDSRPSRNQTTTGSSSGVEDGVIPIALQRFARTEVDSLVGLLNHLGDSAIITPAALRQSDDEEWSGFRKSNIVFWRIRGCNDRASDAEIDLLFRCQLLNPTDCYIGLDDRKRIRGVMRRYGNILTELSRLAGEIANREASALVRAGRLASAVAPVLGHGVVSIVHKSNGRSFPATYAQLPLTMEIWEARNFVRQQFIFEVIQLFAQAVPLNLDMITDQVRTEVRDEFLENTKKEKPQ